MTLSRIAAPFDHPDFLFELKHDGFRCLAYISESRCDLVSRRKYSYKTFDSVKTALAILKATDAILDDRSSKANRNNKAPAPLSGTSRPAGASSH
jgi:ATP-dependent DNA ligase